MFCHMQMLGKEYQHGLLVDNPFSHSVCVYGKRLYMADSHDNEPIRHMSMQKIGSVCVCVTYVCAEVLRFRRSLILFCIHTHTHTISCWYYPRTLSLSASGLGTLYELGVSLSVCLVHSLTHIKMLQGLYKVMKTITTEMLVLHNLNYLFHKSHLYCSSAMFWFNKKKYIKNAETGFWKLF